MPPLDSDSPHSLIGRTLAHYRIAAHLGAGSSGEVYLAEDLKLARKVALKLIPPLLSSDPENLERFEREARLLAALNHPSIVTIYSVEEAEGYRFLTMELVEGSTLSSIIPETGLPLRQFLEIAIPLVSALCAAHESGITHRDLKPANIMVGSGGKVKVLDFGLAKLRRGDALGGSQVLEKSITQQGVILGTLQYMSPEQVEGKTVDPRSDLFSLGIIFHEMVTGQRPFQGDTGPSLISSIFRDEAPSVLEVRPDLPEEVAAVILRCLEKNPDHRCQSARELLLDLEAVKSWAAPVGTSSRTLAPGSSGILRPASSGTVASDVTSDSGPGALLAGAGRRRLLLMAVAALLLVAVGAFGGARLYRGLAGTQRRIVVLPFENLGQSDDAYFAAGITEEITSRLSSVRGLGVISRTSALQYRKEGKTIKQIGRDLGANYVLEGTVRWDHPSGGSNRVRVTPELIRVRDDTHLWSERYERDVQAIFDVQTDIAEQVVQKLNVTLHEPEKRALESGSTRNLDAHLAYLRGMAYGRGATEQDAYLAVQMLEQAVTLDPGYIDAYYRLSRSHVYLYGSHIDPTPERLAKAKAAADRILELAPDSPEGHRALGAYYVWGEKDQDKALEQYAIVLKKLPNDANALASVGYIQMYKGLFQEAAATMEKALTLDPQNGDLTQFLGEVYERLRMYPEAESAFNRGITIAPDDLLAYWRKADLYRIWDGQPERSRAALEAMPAQSDVESTRNWFYQEFLEHKWQAALDRVSAATWEWYDALPKGYLEYLCYYRLGKPQKARACAEEALSALEKRLPQRQEDAETHSALGLVYAALGRKDDAIREGQRGIALTPVQKDPYIGPYRVIDLAKIYAQVGELDKAMDQVDYLLSIPACFSVGMLRLDPDWERLSGFPRFEKLLSRA